MDCNSNLMKEDEEGSFSLQQIKKVDLFLNPHFNYFPTSNIFLSGNQIDDIVIVLLFYFKQNFYQTISFKLVFEENLKHVEQIIIFYLSQFVNAETFQISLFYVQI